MMATIPQAQASGSVTPTFTFLFQGCGGPTSKADSICNCMLSTAGSSYGNLQFAYTSPTTATCYYQNINNGWWFGGKISGWLVPTCPSNSTWDGFSNSCWCIDPNMPDASGKSCVPITCESGYQPNSAGTGCIPDNSCPSNMDGTPCVCIENHVPNPAGDGCILEQYTLSLISDQVQLVAPSNAASIITMVKDAQGNGKSEVRVSIRVDVDASSGGHDHGGTNRDKGSPAGEACDPPASNCAIVTTDPGGYATSTFNAPAVSGKHTFTAACVSPACSGTATGTINVKVDGLEQIPSSEFYALNEQDGNVIGAVKGRHTSNHYLTARAANRLLVIAINHHHINPQTILHINDASLMWGGVFDIDVDAEWNTPHEEHRSGTVVDIRANSRDGAIPPANFKTFIKLARQLNMHAKIHSAGSTNQHFHVRLLNRSE